MYAARGAAAAGCGAFFAGSLALCPDLSFCMCGEGTAPLQIPVGIAMSVSACSLSGCVRACVTVMSAGAKGVVFCQAPISGLCRACH